MDIAGWNERYRSGSRASEDLEASPTPLVMETAEHLKPGRALDLACGSGRNAIFLAEQGWKVTAMDAAGSAIAVLRDRAADRRLAIDCVVADLQAREFAIEEESWDLILLAYYLQRDLFEAAKAGVKPGGVLIAIVHIAECAEQPTAHRLLPGELRDCFAGWTVLHDYEGQPRDQAHRRSVAEIVARRPL